MVTVQMRTTNYMPNHKFNDDVRLDAADRQSVSERWPTLATVLVNDELLEIFREHEQTASTNKNIVYVSGTAAVISLVCSLCVMLRQLADGPGGSEFSWPPHSLSAYLAASGILLGLISSRYCPYRRRWLASRFVTESLRAWHFSELLRASDATGESGVASDADEYRTDRRRRLKAFTSDLLATAASRMDRMREHGDTSVATSTGGALRLASVDASELAEAFRVLRLEHQLLYAMHKLSPDDRTVSGLPLVVLGQVTDLLAALSLMAALCIAAAELVFGAPTSPSFALAFTVLGIGVRAWRDGLGLGADELRYREYEFRLSVLKGEWDEMPDLGSRRRIMRETEAAVADELRAFLRAHEHAQYLF